MKRQVAKEMVWADADGKLVKDGDESAHELVARKGQLVPERKLERFKGVEAFFTPLSHDIETGEPVLPKQKEAKTKPAAPRKNTARKGKTRVVAKPE
ncbi:MAG TPA: hypothetical protein VF089_17890 [Candidatus Binatia bacterium]